MQNSDRDTSGPAGQAEGQQSCPLTPDLAPRPPATSYLSIPSSRGTCALNSAPLSPLRASVSLSTKPGRETGPLALRGWSANQCHPPPLCCWLTISTEIKSSFEAFTAYDIATQPSTRPAELSCWTEHRLVYKFPADAIVNYHKLGGITQQKFILSQFWGPEAWNQGVGRATLPPETLGKKLLPVFSSFSCLLAFLGLGPHHSSTSLPSLCVCVRVCMCVCVCKISFFFFVIRTLVIAFRAH